MHASTLQGSRALLHTEFEFLAITTCLKYYLRKISDDDDDGDDNGDDDDDATMMTTFVRKAFKF